MATRSKKIESAPTPPISPELKSAIGLAIAEYFASQQAATQQATATTPQPVSAKDGKPEGKFLPIPHDVPVPTPQLVESSPWDPKFTDSSVTLPTIPPWNDSDRHYCDRLLALATGESPNFSALSAVAQDSAFPVYARCLATALFRIRFHNLETRQAAASNASLRRYIAKWSSGFTLEEDLTTTVFPEMISNSKHRPYRELLWNVLNEFVNREYLAQAPQRGGFKYTIPSWSAASKRPTSIVVAMAHGSNWMSAK